MFIPVEIEVRHFRRDDALLDGLFNRG